MVAFKLRRELAGLAVLLLAGCASGTYWQADSAWFGFKPTHISVIEKEDPSALCGAAPQSVFGCAIMQRTMNHCTVFVNSRLTDQAYSCTVTHEMRHCFGDHHRAFDNRPHYAIDCGDGEVYGGMMKVGR